MYCRPNLVMKYLLPGISSMNLLDFKTGMESAIIWLYGPDSSKWNPGSDATSSYSFQSRNDSLCNRTVPQIGDTFARHSIRSLGVSTCSIVAGES